MQRDGKSNVLRRGSDLTVRINDARRARSIKQTSLLSTCLQCGYTLDEVFHYFNN